MEENEKRSLLGKGMHVGERLAEVGDEATRLKTAASHAVEDAVTEAKRLAKRSRYAAEDLSRLMDQRLNVWLVETGHTVV